MTSIALKELRTELGLTQAEFGKLFGFNRAASISDIENGKEPISRQVAQIYSLLMFLRERNLLTEFLK